jgi:hypothetical protein
MRMMEIIPEIVGIFFTGGRPGLVTDDFIACIELIIKNMNDYVYRSMLPIQTG